MLWQAQGIVVDGNPAAQNFPDDIFRQRLVIQAGVDGTLVVPVNYPSGAPVPLTGWTAPTLAVRNQWFDPDPPPVSRSGVIFDATNGILHFPIVGADTLLSGLNFGPCQWDVHIKDPSGNWNALIPTSPFINEGPVGLPTSPTPQPPGNNTRVVTVMFSNSGSGGVTQAFTAFSPLGTLSILSSSAPVALSGGDLPFGVAVTALSNGSITVKTGADWSGYITFTVLNT